MNKSVEGAQAALADLKDGAVILIGGFGLSGLPENLLEALIQTSGLVVVGAEYSIETGVVEFL